MNRLKNFYNSFNWNWFELLLILIVTVISGYFMIDAVSSGDWVYAMIDFVAAVAGIFSVVLCAKGKKSGFVFGLINVIGYSLIAFNSQYYGEVMLNVLFYVPMNIVSYVNWKNHQVTETNEVARKSLTLPQILVGTVIIAAITFAYHLLLTSLGGALTMLDGTTTVLSIVATILMATRYSEQWLCWIVVDAITVVMWVIAFDPIMIVMWGAYLVNAFYGYWLWKKNSQ